MQLAGDQDRPDPGQVVERRYFDNLLSDRFRNRQDLLLLFVVVILQTDQ
jgi:hypothetical protein